MKHYILLGALLLAVGCSNIEEITPKSPFHGIHGIGFDQQGRLLAGSVLGSTLYAVDIESGTRSVLVPPPLGQADDVAFYGKDTLAWTAFLDGKVYIRDGSGEIRTIAEKLPGMNSLAFAADGRLYATQVFLGDALYELDPSGKKPPRKIMEGMGGLNGFEIDKNGKLYGPLWFKGKVVEVDLAKAKMRTIASGFKTPAAVNIDPKTGALYVVDTSLGQVIRVNRKSGKKKVIAKVNPAIDNLAFDKDGRLFISNMSDNAIIEINKKTGESRTIISGKLAAAGGLAIGDENGVETLYVADVFALRSINVQTREVKTIARVFGDEIDYPINIKLTAKYILLTGWSAGSVQVLDRKTKRSLALLHGFTTPHDAVEMPNGDLLVAEFATGKLLRLSGKGWKKKKTFATGLVGSPANLLLSRDKKTLYILENKAGRLFGFNLRSRKLSVIVQGLQGAEGLAFLPDGRFVVAETKLKRILAIDKAGNRKVLASGLPINKFSGGPVSTVVPTGIAVSKDGSVYFTSDEFANVWKIKQ